MSQFLNVRTVERHLRYPNGPRTFLRDLMYELVRRHSARRFDIFIFYTYMCKIILYNCNNGRIYCVHDFKHRSNRIRIIRRCVPFLKQDLFRVSVTTFRVPGMTPHNAVLPAFTETDAKQLDCFLAINTLPTQYIKTHPSET